MAVDFLTGAIDLFAAGHKDKEGSAPNVLVSLN